MSTVIDKLLNRGFNLQEAKIFDYLTCLIQEGTASTQVPLIEIGFDKPSYEDIDFKNLFKNNYVVWSTDKGVIKTEECRNSDTKRLISGYLFMSASYVENHLELMYEVFSESGVNETTVADKKEFLALIVTNTLHQKAPKGKEKLCDEYLKLCIKLYPGEDIINNRIGKYCPGEKKMKIKF